MNEQGCIPTVIQQEVRTRAVRPDESLVGAPPVLLQCLALPGEYRSPLRITHRALLSDDDGRGSVILRREDVARHPAHIRAELRQGLDQDSGLHGHVQGPHDLRAGEGLLSLVLRAKRLQPGHLVFGETNLIPPVFGQLEILDLVRLAPGLDRRCECIHRFCDRSHFVLH